MYDPHRYPRHIITNHLIIDSIIISHEDSYVLLMALFGNTADGNTEAIEIECDFDMLNALLAGLAEGSALYPEMAQRAEEVIDQLAEALTHPTDDNRFLLLGEEGPLYFYHHVFSLQLLDEDTGEEGAEWPSQPCYQLLGVIERAPEWPNWVDDWLPDNKAEQPAYHNRALVLRYGIFLAFKDRLERTLALHIANLTDPQVFAMAKLQYELLAEEQKNRSVDDYDI